MSEVEKVPDLYLWGDVGMVGKRVMAGLPKFGGGVSPIKATKVSGFRFDGVSHGSFQSASVEAQKRNPDGTDHPSGSWFKISDSKNRGAATKNDGGSWFTVGSPGQKVTGQNPDGRKVAGDWFGSYADMKAAGTISPGRLHGKNTVKRKAASAMIAKIPFPLAKHIALVFKGVRELSI